MQIAVCDDNAIVLREINELLLGMDVTENVCLFSDTAEFMRSVEQGKVYDVVLMDISFEQEDRQADRQADRQMGLDAAEALFKLCPATKVIYITGYIDYCTVIFLRRSNVTGFIKKPIDPDILRNNLLLAADSLSVGDEPVLILKQGGATVHVICCEILYIESSGHVIKTHTTSGEVIVTYERLANIINLLPPEFCQCHKSYVVNMRQIKRFESNNKIILKNCSSIPVSRSRYNEAKKKYFRFIGQLF